MNWFWGLLAFFAYNRLSTGNKKSRKAVEQLIAEKKEENEKLNKHFKENGYPQPCVAAA